MNKIFARGIALLMAAVMLFELPGMGAVQAKGLDDEIVFDNVVDEMTVSANETEENAEDNDIDTIFEGETENDEDEADSVSDNSVSENDVHNPLLQFVYIENPIIETPDTQNILIGIGDEDTNLTEGALTYQNIRTKETFTLKAGDKDVDVFTDTLLFTKDFSDESEKGIYQLLNVTYKTETSEGKITLSDMTGISAYFGVNEEVILTDEEPDYSNIEISSEIIALNDNGGAEAIASVEKAIAAANEEITLADSIKPQLFSNASIDTGVAQRNRANGNLVIMLDPGHDNISVGARANGLKEEELNLKIAKYCKEELEKYANVTVHMTRGDGSCPAGYTSGHDLRTCLEKRVQLAQSVGADVFVSFHINASTGAAAKGATVYYPNSNYNAQIGEQGKALAAKIQAKLAELGLQDRGITTQQAQEDKYPDGSAADYMSVIRNSKKAGIPAVLIEHAFITNGSDAAFLAQESNLKKLGIADATGVANNYNLKKKSETSTKYTSGALVIAGTDLYAGSFSPQISAVAPTKNLNKVVFKVWTKSDKSDIKSYKAKVLADGTYTAQVDAWRHNKAEGNYYVEAYAVENNGAECFLKNAVVKLVPSFKASVSANTYGSAKDKYRVELKGLDKAEAVKVKFWYKSQGESSAVTYKARKTSKGTWYYNIPISKMVKEGKYGIKVYAQASYGKEKRAASKTINYKRQLSLSINASSKKQKYFQANLTGGSYFKNVKFQVWSKEDGKDDLKTYKARKKSGGVWYYNIPISKHKKAGIYYVETYGTIGGGEQKIVSRKSFRVKGPSAKKITITNKNEDALTFRVNAQGVIAPSGIKKAEILIWSKKDKSDLKTYKVKINSSGNGKVTAKLKHHKNYFGKYTIQLKLTDNTNITKTVLTKKYTFKQPKADAAVKAANKTETKFDITAAKLSYATKVSFNVWSSADGKDDLKTYNAKKDSKGQWKYRMSLKNHAGSGKYNVYVYATINDKKKLVCKARFNVKQAYNNNYSIMGNSSATVDQMIQYYNENAAYPEFYSSSDAPNLKKYCQIYLDECKTEGVKAEVAFIQAMKETNFLKYGGDVDITQYNFAGIGATGNGEKGLSFYSVRIGIRAHVQHLKAYASTEPLVNECVDPRFIYVSRGSAPYVEWLGIRENPQGKGWATDPGYGIDIVNRIKDLKTK